jgi:hypothetical protein
VDEVALIRDTTSHYAPVLIAPLSINSSLADCSAERSFFGDVNHAGRLLPLVGFVLVGGIVAEIINAVIGAVIILLLIGLFKRD